MTNKKRVQFQQFGIIHLSNSDITYIRNSKRETNYIYILPPLENLHRESFSIFYFFFSPSHLPWPCRCQPGSTRIFPRGEVSFAKLISIFTKLVCQTVGG
jgi:hypothetical protein